MAIGYSNAGGSIAVDSILDLQSTNPVQNATVTAALNNKADIYDLGTLQDTVQSLGETIDQVNENLSNEIAGKQDTLNEEQMDAVNSGITSTILNEKMQELAIASQDILVIQGKIPNQASSSNQLADKDFVNSSISTNTANFIGTFNSIEELEEYSGSITNNDYAFVIDDDGSGTTVYNRYKYNGTGWAFEYSLNNSSFTAAQWSAINSGATTSIINSIAGKANLADLATVATSGSYNDLSDKPIIPATVTVDNSTINKNASNELQAIAVLNKNSSVGATNPLNLWEGTESSWADYQQATYKKYGLNVNNVFQAWNYLPNVDNPVLGYGLGKYWLFGTSDGFDAAYASTDLSSWDYSNPLPNSAGLRYVSEANGRLYAGRNYSTNGTNWNALSGLTGNGTVSNVIYTQAKYFVMVDGKMYRSANGTEFSLLHTYGDSGTSVELLYGNNVFVTLVNNNSDTPYVYDTILLYGSDPAALTGMDLGNVANVGLAYGNGIFLVTYTTGSFGNTTTHILRSSNGLNWTEVTYNNFDIQSLLFFGGYFIAKERYSVDGIEWFAFYGTPIDYYKYTSNPNNLIVCGSSTSNAFLSSTGSLPQDLAGCYIVGTPAVGSAVYSAPDVLSNLTITSIDNDKIVLSNNKRYGDNYNDVTVSKTVADIHPDWLCNIKGVGVKIGNTMIAEVNDAELESRVSTLESRLEALEAQLNNN